MSNVEQMQKDIAAARQEIAVIVRVLQEAGVTFNRDSDGNICGLVIDAQATVVGIGGANA